MADDAKNVGLGMQHGLKNREGKGVEQVGDPSPARWKIADTTNPQ
jgi:hypothetical protein